MSDTLADRLTEYANHLTEVGQRNMTAPYMDVVEKGGRELTMAADLREARDQIKWLTDALNKQRRAAEGGWRCFHCDAVFSDRAEAEKHFGRYGDGPPECAALAVTESS